jgi:hypothetical protein
MGSYQGVGLAHHAALAIVARAVMGALLAIGTFKSMVFGNSLNMKDEATVKGYAALGRIVGAVVSPFVIVLLAWWLR